MYFNASRMCSADAFFSIGFGVYRRSSRETYLTYALETGLKHAKDYKSVFMLESLGGAYYGFWCAIMISVCQCVDRASTRACFLSFFSGIVFVLTRAHPQRSMCVCMCVCVRARTRVCVGVWMWVYGRVRATVASLGLKHLSTGKKKQVQDLCIEKFGISISRFKFAS